MNTKIDNCQGEIIDLDALNEIDLGDPDFVQTLLPRAGSFSCQITNISKSDISIYGAGDEVKLSPGDTMGIEQ